MKLKLLLCVVGLLWVPAVCGYKKINTDASGFFEGRSGQIHVDQERKVDEEAVLLASSRFEFRSAQDLKAKYDDLAPFVADVFGISSYFPPSTLAPRFPAVVGDLFVKPRVNALLFFPGFAPDGPAHAPGIRELRASQPSLRFKRLSPPAQPAVARLASLVTGTPPRRHGVVAEHVMVADGSAHAPSMLTPTLTDLFLTAYDEEPFVLSVSSSPALARLGGLSQVSSGLKGDRVHVVTWNDELQATDGEGNLFPKLDDFEFGDFSIAFASDTIVVKRSAAPAHTFARDAPGVSKFFGELFLLRHGPEVVAAHLCEGAPALFFYSMDSLETLVALGDASVVPLALAYELIDVAVVETYERLDELSGNRMFGQLVFGPASPRVDSACASTMRRSLGHRLLNPTHFEELLPLAYVRSAVDVAEACRELDELLEFQVHCFVARSPLYGYGMPFLMANGSSSNHTHGNGSALSSGGGNYTYLQVENYQVVLWVSVILITIVLVSVLGIAFMPVDKDSLIYRLSYQKQKKL